MDKSIINLYVSQLLAGYTICEVGDRTVFVGAPTLLSNIYAEKKYIEAIRDGELNDLMSEDKKLELLMSLGLWSLQEEKEFSELPKEIENLKVSLYNAYEKFKMRDAIRKQINQKRTRFTKLIKRRSKYDFLTIEGNAQLVKLKYLICSAAYDENGEKIWSNLDFLQEEGKFVERLIQSYQKNEMKDDIIRYISHNDPWKLIWMSSKGFGGKLFDAESIGHLTKEQMSVINWSRLYDNIYENPECPPAEVINEDDMLDGWLIVQSNKRKNEQAKKDGAGENFILVENPEDVSRVHQMNSPQAKLVKAQRMSALKKAGGKLEEQHMPDSKLAVREQAMQKFREQVKGNRK